MIKLERNKGDACGILPFFYFNRASAKSQSEDYHGAITDMNNAIFNSDPNDFSLFGSMYLERGKLKFKLIEVLNKGLENANLVYACLDFRVAKYRYDYDEAEIFLEDFCIIPEKNQII